MVRKITTVAVDQKWFRDFYEKERMKMQKKIGLSNLSQANFSKMIIGIKIKQPKQDSLQVNTRIKRRKNVKI